MEKVNRFRTALATLLLTLPPLCAQAERVVSPTDGNFELTGTVRAATNPAVILRFRAKSGLGYRLLLSGPAMGRLDDPGRRAGVLAAPAAQTKRVKPDVTVRLTVDGPQIRLEFDGQPVWSYTEKEAGVASAGAVRVTGPVRDLAFNALPATAPAFAERYGPGIGEKAPPIVAVDQTGKTRDLASLREPKGLWVLFFRSADW